MTDTSALVAFIRERIDEDERYARAAFPGPWRYNPRKQWLPHEDKAVRDAAARAGYLGEEFVGAGPLDSTVGVAATGPAHDPQSMADAAHIARHDPARVLRDVEAKRALLDWAVRLDPPYGLGGIIAGEARRVQRLLALPYSDHPSYQEEWRP